MVKKGFPRRVWHVYHVLPPPAGFECLPPATVVTPVNRLTLIVGYKMLPLLKLAFLTMSSGAVPCRIGEKSKRMEKVI